MCGQTLVRVKGADIRVNCCDVAGCNFGVLTIGGSLQTLGAVEFVRGEMGFSV